MLSLEPVPFGGPWIVNKRQFYYVFFFLFLFSVNLYELKTYHEVIDEIYYKVQHLEPWEKGSRKTAGQTGMCGGVSIVILILHMREVL